MDRVQLHILNLTVTLRCTLNCKLCVADISKYSVLPHFEANFLCDCIDKVFEIVDYTDRFQLSGGEPLMHKNLPEIMRSAMQHNEQFGFLGIFTNGTLLPSDDLIKTILSYQILEKFKFYISDYGKYSPKVDETKRILQLNSIPYEVKDYSSESQHMGGWVDYGDYEYRSRTDKEHANVFKNCAVNGMGGVWACRFGQIHKCTRSASGMSLNKLPDDKSDYIDLFDGSELQMQKEKLRKIMNKSVLTACKYCAGNFGTTDKSLRFPAAEQI